MENIIDNIRERLMGEIDEKYRSFNSSLVPGDMAPMLGVRMPKLREIAKEIAREEGRKYIKAIVAMEKETTTYHEEHLLHGMVIGYLKCGIDERAELLDEFVPVIDNWAVCDSSCMTYKFMKKDMDYWFKYLLKYLESNREYEIRFAVVSFLDYFISEEYIREILKILGSIKHEGYYVKMAVAWAVSVCYVKFPERTWELLEGNELDDFTHQKSIQKIRESFCVPKEEKDRLLTLRRSRKG